MIWGGGVFPAPMECNMKEEKTRKKYRSKKSDDDEEQEQKQDKEKRKPKKRKKYGRVVLIKDRSVIVELKSGHNKQIFTDKKVKIGEKIEI